MLATDPLQTASERAIQKVVETTGDLAENKSCSKICFKQSL